MAPQERDGSVEFEATGQVPSRGVGSGARLLAGDHSLHFRDFISYLPDKNITCSPEKYWVVFLLFKVWRNCCFPKVFTATIREVLSWQTFSTDTVVTIKLPPLPYFWKEWWANYSLCYWHCQMKNKIFNIYYFFPTGWLKLQHSRWYRSVLWSH